MQLSKNGFHFRKHLNYDVIRNFLEEIQEAETINVRFEAQMQYVFAVRLWDVKKLHTFCMAIKLQIEANISL